MGQAGRPTVVIELSEEETETLRRWTHQRALPGVGAALADRAGRRRGQVRHAGGS